MINGALSTRCKADGKRQTEYTAPATYSLALCYENDTFTHLCFPTHRFSERFEKTHRVTKCAGFSDIFDIEKENQITVQFRQQIPFLTTKDCPYAYEDDPIVKSMLRALYG